MPPRLYCPDPLRSGLQLALPPTATRHVQVLRLQPGSALTLFDGRGGEWDARVLRIGRSEVEAVVGEHRALEREASLAVHIAVGVPANDRMDWMIEKATELGVTAIQPLFTHRSVLRLSDERAARRQAHWQAIAQAACEQSGRNRVPHIALPCTLQEWLAANAAGSAGAGSAGVSPAQRLLLSPTATAPLPRGTARAQGVVLLSGPEGGLSDGEEDAARQHGFAATSLGPRVLRADTAPLAALAALTVPLQEQA